MTGEMYTHDDEPSTKKIIVDDPDDSAHLGDMVNPTLELAIFSPGKSAASQETE